MGAVLKGAKGPWTIVVYVGKRPDGRRKKQWITSKRSKEDDERRLSEILKRVNDGLYINPSKDTLGSFLFPLVPGQPELLSTSSPIQSRQTEAIKSRNRWR